MAAGRNDIEMRITADSRGVAAGLAPALKGLDGVQRAAADTEQSLNDIGAKPVTLNVNDQAIEAARDEITRLRGQMREELSTDVNADTSAAQKRIKELQKTIRVLDAEHPEIEVAVTANTTGLAGLKAALLDAQAAAGSGGLSGGLTALAGSATRLGGSLTVVGGAATIAGAGILSLNQSAADAQTSITQLDALTGGLGEETFADLQKWAAATPFAIEDATEATKKLVAAGVPLEDIPDFLNDIGNVASATTGDLAQAATIFSQMVSKGKASYEELQQLAEAGVPVWPTLAEQMGLTVAEVQKLATEGKLGADAIDLTREALGQLYPTSMQDQAETFNGQMSTLKDNLSQTGQTLGQLFLPAMTALAEVTNKVAGWMLEATHWLTEFDDKLRQATGSGIFEQALSVIVPGLGGAAKQLEDTGDEAEDTGEKFDDLGGDVKTMADKVVAGLDDGTAAAEAFKKEVEGAQAAVEAAINAFAGLGGNIRTTVSFIITRDDLRESIHEAIEGTKDEAAVTLPANLKVEDIEGLGDKQQDLISQISGFAEQGLEEGARRAELNPQFNERAWLRQVRAGTRGLLIDAGIDEQAVNRVLKNIFGLPQVVPIDADISGAQEDLDTLTNPIPVPITPFVSQKDADANRTLPDWLTGGVTAPVVPEVTTPDEASTALDGVAKPDGKPRTATIVTHLEAASLAIARSTLDRLLETQTKIIKVHLEENPTGADLSGPGAVDRLLGTGSSTITVGGGKGSAGGDEGTPGHPRRLAPRQTPVAVYLDGVEIAHRIEARRAAAATASVRRSA